MPIIKSAKKALRGSRRKRVYNERRKRAFRDTTKGVRKSFTTNPAEASKNLAAAYKALDKAAKNGVIKKNAAARKKSRLAKALAKVNK